MDVAKSLFGTRDHEGYVGKDEHMVRFMFPEFVFSWGGGIDRFLLCFPL